MSIYRTNAKEKEIGELPRLLLPLVWLLTAWVVVYAFASSIKVRS